MARTSCEDAFTPTRGDTCATGHLSTPDNVGYGQRFRDFVFRRPRNATKLAALMSADPEEVFACYRFRWARSVDISERGSSVEDADVMVGCARQVMETSNYAAPEDSSRRYRDYISGVELVQ